MNPFFKSLLFLPLFLIAWVLLFVVWLGNSIGGGPNWISWVSVTSAVLLLGGWLAMLFVFRAAVLLRRAFLVGGGLGLAVVMVNILIVEPYQRRERQMENNRILYQERLDTALEQIVCPSGQILVVVPGIGIVQEDGIRRMLELYLLPPDPARRAIKLVNTRHDGRLVRDPLLEEMLPEITACFGSEKEWIALLQRMEEGEFAVGR